jgi:hypothetical protein
MTAIPERLTQQQYRETAAYIRERTRLKPTVGLVLGSGLSSLADQLEQADVFPYEQLPHFAQTTVHGHVGRLLVGKLEGQTATVMQGRFHFYEGHSMQRVTFPIRVMGVLGIQTLIVTNAAGGIAPRFTAGELMLITDHLNMVGMGGRNPLIGPNDPELGPRLPDMSQAWPAPALRPPPRSAFCASLAPMQLACRPFTKSSWRAIWACVCWASRASPMYTPRTLPLLKRPPIRKSWKQAGSSLRA